MYGAKFLQFSAIRKNKSCAQKVPPKISSVKESRLLYWRNYTYKPYMLKMILLLRFAAQSFWKGFPERTISRRRRYRWLELVSEHQFFPTARSSQPHRAKGN